MNQPPPESDDSIIVARVNRPHGRDGALSVELLSDLPGRFDAGREMIADGTPYSISASRQTGPDTALLWLEGITSRHLAAPLSGKYLSAAPDDQVSLEDGEYFHYQLIGLKVSTKEGEELGELQEILETGSNDVYIVRGAQGEILIPAMAQVVLEVDIAAGAMVVDLLDGLR